MINEYEIKATLWIVDEMIKLGILSGEKYAYTPNEIWDDWYQKESLR